MSWFPSIGFRKSLPESFIFGFIPCGFLSDSQLNSHFNIVCCGTERSIFISIIFFWPPVVPAPRSQWSMPGCGPQVNSGCDDRVFLGVSGIKQQITREFVSNCVQFFFSVSSIIPWPSLGQNCSTVARRHHEGISGPLCLQRLKAQVIYRYIYIHIAIQHDRTVKSY